MIFFEKEMKFLFKKTRHLRPNGIYKGHYFCMSGI